jgi:transcriptional regulator with XRE-family HTH domain
MDETQRNVAESFRALSAVCMDKQAEIGAVLGISQKAVSQKLNGRISWSASDIALLARWYGVTVDQVMAGPRSWLGKDGQGWTRESDGINICYPSYGSVPIAA